MQDKEQNKQPSNNPANSFWEKPIGKITISVIAGIIVFSVGFAINRNFALKPATNEKTTDANPNPQRSGIATTAIPKTARTLPVIAPTDAPTTLSSPVRPPSQNNTNPLDEILIRIKVKSQSGMSYEELVQFLDEAKVQAAMARGITPKQDRVFSCYSEVEAFWIKSTPAALQHAGVVSSWVDAKNYFEFNIEPELSKKLTECSSYQ